MHACAVASVQ